ncbi:cellulose binding domain-containing protein [Nonomuraea solani]|uniref:cellulose binding domain-containing protein n=1 Tax=Nonomuraea solani TaxID=1144553 RepID=UPI00190E817A|nr:cellulose binding domain-containing protein [Nonomuraea solani]
MRRCLIALAVVLVGLPSVTALPASGAAAATVSIDAGQALATIPAVGVGMNVAVWDGRMNDPVTSTLLKDAGVTAVRYPGGSYADGYHWQTHTTENGWYMAANTEFDKYVATTRAAGAQPIVTANYGSGTAQEAADWVRYANVTKGYGIKYWEIGNEVYGNGHYGAEWELDKHASKSPATYATNLVQYVTAMKAVDPTIKIGAVLTTPGNWPDGIVGPGDTQDWNNTVMSIAGSRVDFVIVHHYPYSTNEGELLTKPQAEISTMTRALRDLINRYAGPHVGIAVTEESSNFALNTSPSGLYAPDAYLTWMENGAFTIDWWNLRNGTDCQKVTVIQGATDYNDGGIVSSGETCEPPANTPFPPYYGLQMITKLGGPGDALVRATSSGPLLSAHAVKRANGDVNVMLINKDPGNDVTVDLSYSGFTPSSATPTVYSYRKNASSIGSAATGTAATQTVPAYSIVVVQLRAGSGGGTSACQVDYTKNEWQGGLTANATIRNTGSGPVNGWRLTFTFPGDTKVTNAWNASVTQSGAAVTATNASYNATIPAGGSQSFGFQGTWTGNNANPTGFALNGAACTTGQISEAVRP